MNAVATAVVHYPFVNNPEQERELVVRALVIVGEKFGQAILHRDVAEARVTEMLKADVPVCMRELRAPHGMYLGLCTGETNIVAVHRRVEDGTITAYGPFISHESAYDYFPEGSSPHDTFVSVSEVFADIRAPEEREPAFD